MPKENLILGAIAGDIIGSVYEWNNIKTVDFDLFSEESDSGEPGFTDDSVLVVATIIGVQLRKKVNELHE